MGKVKAKGKDRLDKFYRLAKEHGYRSRASWKLLQLDSKFRFLHSSRAVLDLCAAPGGWMQIAVQKAPAGSLIIGVDLVPIKPLQHAITVQEDITQPRCRATIKKLLAENGCRAFDLVLHDGSPNIGGAWAQEATTQNALVIDSVKLATEFLAPKGTFVTKVFRSQDYSAVLYCLKQLFEKVEVDKPAASRSTSAEIYVIGLKYKAPAKIDPRLLDFKQLFQGGKETPKVLDVLKPPKQKRHRDGYEDGETLVRKVCSGSDFVWSDSPLEILGSVTSITFEDPTCLTLRDHTSTTEEIKALCDDLRVLGKQDFKHLLKWRMGIRKTLSPSQKAASTTIDVEHESKESKETEDDRILNEMEELTYANDHKKKRAKKLLAKRLAKDKARKAMGMQVDATEDGYMDHELFSLSSIKGKNDLVAVNTAASDDETGDLGDSENEETRKEQQESSSSDIDSDEERRKYVEQMEEILDEVYERYVEKKEGSTKQRKRAKQIHSKDSELFEGGNDSNTIHSDQDSDNDQGDHEANPLMMPIVDEEQTQEEIARKWFSLDVFDEADEPEDMQKSDSEDEMLVDGAGNQFAPQKGAKKNQVQVAEPGEHLAIPTKMEKNKVQVFQASKAEDDFEIVPASATDSSDDSSSDESEDEDVNTKAEILAYAKKMLRKKPREQMLDDAYNKYMFHDDGLPKWFLDEEKKHRQPVKPVTKEEINAMRAQFKEIDARPAKKVAEAKARKKRIATRKLEKVRKKANTISDQADVSDRSKRKMIEQLYKKATPKRPEKEYVVAKKGVQVRTGKGKVLVDRRMKKDAARSQGTSKKGKGNSKGKGAKGKGLKFQKGKGPGKTSGMGRKGNKGKK